ncbi:GNAT family N-acetyltransferase [Lactococcus garvieae]|uniref:GNAT family N-acetyltransferase n=1 Tax=Lactococcus garvieae TaxID=1363 RepID=UPI0009C0DEB5|nr:GNAT family N-acetyltransferase [Lactococcus garvieae]
MNTELLIREATKEDSAKLIAFLDQIGKESHFLTLDEAGILMSETQMEDYLEQISQKDNNAYFLAFLGEEIAGVLHITADFHYRIRHIGDIFIAVASKFQGYGVASFLFTDALEWVEETGVIKRLELTVQKRNKAAIHLYEKFGFELEAIQKYGARDEDGHLIDVCEMVKFF